MQKNKLKIAFFGTSDFSVKILEQLKKHGFSPSLIITTPDKHQGRKLILTPPPVKTWAQENNIDFLQPATLDDEFTNRLNKKDWDLFIVAFYGKIIPENILEMPKHKTINVHPSLLPRLRGASPMISAILTEKETGVTIMLMDNETDHGPILKQEKVKIENWPPKIKNLEDLLLEKGAKLLVETIPSWIEGKITPQEQNHSQATFTTKIEKKDTLINLKNNPEENLRKIKALQKYKPHFFVQKNGKDVRVIIKDAKIKDGELVITRVLPEGKKEMDYQDFLRGGSIII